MNYYTTNLHDTQWKVIIHVLEAKERNENILYKI